MYIAIIFLHLNFQNKTVQGNLAGILKYLNRVEAHIDNTQLVSNHSFIHALNRNF